ncbi:MAG TPA: TonB-dependent receptor plug domain-containing protein [Opitutaceae bacterium]
MMLLAAMLFAVFSTPATTQAQTQSTGEITGRVVNAANGKYLNSARVIVEGTLIESFTNQSGEYTLRGVSAGQARVKVFYTGQEPQTATVTVEPGSSTVKYFAFKGEREIDANTPIELNEFQVEATRFNDAQELAINEERYAVNIKNVVSADAFGEIPSGNVGEFIKYLPGVELDYGGEYTAPTDAMGISVRGFGAQDTAIYIDGVPVSSASQGSLTNQVGLDMLSINNASRIELIKVPTPDMPMNSIGGQINLISKSAFEYAKPTFNWRAYVTINSEEPNPFQRVPGPKASKVYAGQPGFEMTYVRPVNEKFGFTLTASSFSQYSANRRFQNTWGANNVNLDLRPLGGERNTPATNDLGPVSLANPYLERIQLTDSPRTSRSYSASIKGDWKPFDGLSLSGNYQVSTYEAADAARRIQIRTRTPLDWDSTSTISYPYVPASESPGGSTFNPSNAVDMDIISRDKEGITHTGSIRAKYQKGPWDMSALASASTSRASFKDTENGHFSTVEVGSTVGQIKFENIENGVPANVTVFDRQGNIFDFTKLDNWNSPDLRARSGKAESLDDVFNYKLDVRRDLDFLPWRDNVRLAFKTGFLREETLKKKWGLGTGYRESYIGPDLSTDDYLDMTYLNQEPGYGFAPQEWISTYRLYDIYQENPDNFTVTESDAIENWNSYVGQNKRLKETSDAYYAQIDGTAMSGRLNFIVGMRDEKRTRTGATPQVDGKWNYIKNEDGTLYRNEALAGGVGTVRIDQANSPLFAQDATGTALRSDLSSQGIDFPTSPITSGTLAAAMLQRRALQEVRGKSSGDPNYSINVSYKITDKLTGKVAYTRSNGRIPIEDSTAGILTGSNNFNINENTDPLAIPRGVISVANPNLLPEISDNWDFELTYYTDSGGKIGASYYTKSIKNFSDTVTTESGTQDFNSIMNSLGLDPTDYEDWEIRTAENGIGTGKVDGYEFSAAHDLRFLGDWGRKFNLFATYSYTKREENNTTRISVCPVASDLVTGGINFSANRFRFNIRVSWRDLTFTQGAGNFDHDNDSSTPSIQLNVFDPSAAKIDASLDWQFSQKYSFYISGRNIFEAGTRRIRMDSLGVYPSYAQLDDDREFGVQVTFGIRGSF